MVCLRPLLPVVAVFVVQLLASTVSFAQSPAPAPAPPASESPGAASPSVTLSRWYIVRESVGKGLKKGAGVRFRLDGFDTAEAGKGSANAVPCTQSGAEFTCENGIKAKAVRADEVKVELGPLSLTLGPASAEEATAFTKWLADAAAQQATCAAASRCCRAAEGTLGQACDLKKVLGDRSLAACTAGLEQTRAALTAKKAPAPPECR